MHRTTLIAILLSSSVLSSAAQAQDWQRIGPEGGTPLALTAPDPDGTRAYAVGMGGLFRSDDRGASWTLMPSPNGHQGSQFFTLHGFSRSNPDAVVLGHNDGVWRSIDGGQTWRQLAITAPYDSPSHRFTAVAVDPDDADHVAVFMAARYHISSNATFAALWLSDDGDHGTVLERLPNRNPRCFNIVPSPYEHVNTAAFLDGELYYSHFYRCEGGLWWNDYPVDQYVHRWDHPFFFVDPLMYYGVSASYTAPGSMAASEGKLFFTSNNGPVFRFDLPSETATKVRPRSARLQVGVDGALTSGEADGLFRSTDQGASWQRIDNDTLGVNGIATRSRHFLAEFRSPTHWLAGSSDGLFASDNMGTAWRPSQRGFTSFQVQTIAIDPSNEQRMWIGSRFDTPVLYWTGNGGGIWQTSDVSEIASMLRWIVVDPRSPLGGDQTVLYASGLGCVTARPCANGATSPAGLFRSRNAGASWQPIENAQPMHTLMETRTIAIATVPGAPLPRLAVTADQRSPGMALLSDDAGASWAIASSGLPALSEDASLSTSMDIAFAPSNSQRVYLATVASAYSNANAAHVQRNGVFRSDDGGRTWAHRSNGLSLRPGSSNGSHVGVTQLSVHPTNPDVVYAITPDTGENWRPHYRVYRTVDGGHTWANASSGLPVDTFLAVAIDAHQPDTIYVGGISGMFYSENAGQSWQRLGSAGVGWVTGITVGNRHVFAGTRLGVQKILRPDLNVDPVFCSDFEPGGLIRSLDPRCSGRLWMP